MPDSSKLLKGRYSAPYHHYSVTLCSKNRAKIFNQLRVNQITIHEVYQLEYDRAIKLIAYTLMPDHLHLLFQLQAIDSLSGVVRSLKGRVAAKLRAINVHQVWQRGFYDTCLIDERDLKTQARYIVANPLRAKLVNNIGQYPYWNCIYLYQGIGDL